MTASSVGLYRIESVDKHLCQLALKQLLPAERDVRLTDINFSRSPVSGALLFSRLLELPEFTMTSGAALAFTGEMEAQLARLWAQALPRERYRRFFKLYRRQGVPMIYADVGQGRRPRPAADLSDRDES